MTPPVIRMEAVSKRFGAIQAVQNVSFEVYPGEIFGLLGPNGAGKTTLIRILLDLYRADSGRAEILGGPMTLDKQARIGYMPEERGLYPDERLDRTLRYLASLKGLSSAEIERRLEDWLIRFDLYEHRRKKIGKLSKGMQQKAQLIVTLIHEPEVLIIDEPFSGLDPVNTQMVKDVLLDMRARGTTIVMSTHMMHQVEALCDRLLLIDHGRVMLQGTLSEVRTAFQTRRVAVGTPLDALPPLNGVAQVQRQNGYWVLFLTEEVTPQEVLTQLVAADVPLTHFEVVTPTLDEIFIRVVTGQPLEPET